MDTGNLTLLVEELNQNKIIVSLSDNGSDLKVLAREGVGIPDTVLAKIKTYKSDLLYYLKEVTRDAQQVKRIEKKESEFNKNPFVIWPGAVVDY